MPKKVKNSIKIKPESNNKSKKVLFSFVGSKKSKSIFNKKYDILDLLLKDIEFKKVHNFMKVTSERFDIGINKIKDNKSFRYYLYNVKYYFRKIFITSFLNASYVVLNFIKNIVKKIQHKILQIVSSFNKFNKKEAFKIDVKLNRVKYFFTPDNKSNWIGDFKGFISIVIGVVIVINIVFFSDKITNDISKIILTTAYAEDQINSAISDVKVLNTDLAENKFYLALSSFYNLNEDLSFITKGTFNIVGKLANIQTNDLEEILNNLQNISTSSLKLVDEIELNKDENFLFKIQRANNFLVTINKNIENINSIINSINTDLLPSKYKNQLNTLKQKVAVIKNNSNQVLQASYLMRDILGEAEKKRYILIFQNSNEIRATGGFMGSYALIDTKDGELIKTEVPGGGTYDLQGSFYKNIEPPMPLKLLVNKWEIQDSNWFLDFPKSAKKISQFFSSSSNGSYVDGVIAINSNILPKLLDLTGDINLPKYGITLNKDNVVDQIQDIISSKRGKTTKPKEVISDLFGYISDKLFNINSDNIFKSIDFINSSINEKQILTYFNDSKIENIAKNLNLSGDIKDSKQDYISIVDSNIGGGKTSQDIKRSVSQDIKILPTGEVISTVSITKEMKTDSKDRNIEFIRLYTPEGSKLISSTGFSEDVVVKSYLDVLQTQDIDLDNINKYSIKDKNSNTIIYNDEGKTIFGNFLYLDSGDTKTVTLVYELPFKVDYDKIKSGKDGYYLYMQSQPGIENIDFNLNIRTIEKSMYNNNFTLSKDKIIEVK